MNTESQLIWEKLIDSKFTIGDKVKIHTSTKCPFNNKIGSIKFIGNSRQYKYPYLVSFQYSTSILDSLQYFNKSEISKIK